MCIVCYRCVHVHLLSDYLLVIPWSVLVARGAGSQGKALPKLQAVLEQGQHVGELPSRHRPVEQTVLVLLALQLFVLIRHDA